MAGEIMKKLKNLIAQYRESRREAWTLRFKLKQRVSFWSKLSFWSGNAMVLMTFYQLFISHSFYHPRMPEALLTFAVCMTYLFSVIYMVCLRYRLNDIAHRENEQVRTKTTEKLFFSSEEDLLKSLQLNLGTQSEKSSSVQSTSDIQKEIEKN
jgi:hypothetical protein